MELLGALSNPATLDKLMRLNALRKNLLKDSNLLAEPSPRPPTRAGEMAKTIDAVLAEAGESMRVAEVHAAVERRLQQPVNRRSVKAYLSEATLADRPKFRRTTRGSYRRTD
jgi:hypothetical protein